MQRLFEVASVHSSPKLRLTSVMSLLESNSITSHQFINQDENMRLGMFGTLGISINGDPPPLITNDLDITIKSVNGRSKFRAQDENVDPAEDSERVKRVCDSLLQCTGRRIYDQAVIHVDGSAPLQCLV